jgi:heme-degrading monooxygenase HmoA
MIGRIWHGWTTAGKADAYESLLRGEVLPGIAAMNVPGYRGAEVFRRTLGSGEVEFVTILRFDSIDAVKRFVGDDYEVAHVPSRARAVLSRWDERSQHYEIREHTAYR